MCTAILLCFRGIIGDLEDIYKQTADSAWRQKEALALSKIVQDRLHYLQVE